MAVDEVQLAVGRHLRVHSMVQLQSDVGVFCGILGGGFHRHLVKGHLLGPFAGHLFKADWFKAQMPLAQGIHAVAFVRLKHIRLQQSIVGDAVDGNAMIGQHVLVVFKVLPDFFNGRVF